MALENKVNYKGLEAPKAYINIENYSGSKESIKVLFCVYTNENMRKEGTFLYKKELSIVLSELDLSIGLMDGLYKALKDKKFPTAKDLKK